MFKYISLFYFHNLYSKISIFSSFFSFHRKWGGGIRNVILSFYYKINEVKIKRSSSVRN